jgi:hypothetical protein
VLSDLVEVGSISQGVVKFAKSDTSPGRWYMTGPRQRSFGCLSPNSQTGARESPTLKTTRGALLGALLGLQTSCLSTIAFPLRRLFFSAFWVQPTFNITCCLISFFVSSSRPAPGSVSLTKRSSFGSVGRLGGRGGYFRGRPRPLLAEIASSSTSSCGSSLIGQRHVIEPCARGDQHTAFHDGNNGLN